MWGTKDDADIVIDSPPVIIFMAFNSAENHYETYYTVERPGKIHMRAFGYKEGEIWVEYHTTDDTLSGRITTFVRRVINEDDEYISVTWDPCHVSHMFFLKGPITGDVTLHLTGNPHWGLEWNKKIALVSVGGVVTSSTLEMEQDKYYYTEIAWRFIDEKSNIKLQWSYDGQDTPIDIPSTHFGMASTGQSGIMTKEAKCAGGKKEETIDGLTYWIASCGDGVVDPTEEWDDGNTVEMDGCNGSWEIEVGSYWTGGSPTTQDTWENCLNLGQSVIENSCVTVCGDRVLGPNEQCDDGNDSDGKLSRLNNLLFWNPNILIYRRWM